MKLTTVCFLLLLCSLQSFGQNFAPVGATWYYTQYSAIGPDIGYTSFESLKDTVYQGVDCRKIGGQGSSCAWQAQYMYDSNDSVFFWHPEREEFCLLYDFGAGVGDTWTVHHIGQIGGQPDSSVLTVDSIDIEIIDGHSLKVVYATKQNSTEDWWGVGGKMTERLGGGYLFPTIGVCDPLPGELRCYDDTVISFHQGVYACDEVISSVAENTGSAALSVYPNPSTDIVNIDFGLNIPPPVAIRVVGINGEQIPIKDFKMSVGMVRLDLSDFSSGIYLVELHFPNTTHQSTRIYKP